MNSIKVSSVLLSCIALYASAVPVPKDDVILGTHVEMEANGGKLQEAYAKFPNGNSLTAYNQDIPGKANVNGQKGVLHFEGDKSTFDATAIHEKIRTNNDFSFDKYAGTGKFQHDNGVQLFGGVSHIPKLDTTSYNAGAGVNLWTSQDKKGTLDWTASKSYTTSPFGNQNDFNTFVNFGYRGF